MAVQQNEDEEERVQGGPSASTRSWKPAGRIRNRGNCSCMTGVEYPLHHLLFKSMWRSIQPAPVSVNATAISRSAPGYLRQILFMEMVTTQWLCFLVGVTQLRSVHLWTKCNYSGNLVRVISVWLCLGNSISVYLRNGQHSRASEKRDTCNFLPSVCTVAFFTASFTATHLPHEYLLQSQSFIYSAYDYSMTVFYVLFTCIVICPYNKNQQDALFTFNLFQ